MRNTLDILFSQFFRFAIVGILATLLHYLIYWILNHWLDYTIAFTIGYGLSLICNFFLTSHFTFKEKATVKRGLGFGGAHLLNYIIQISLLNVFVRIGMAENLAPIPVYAISIPLNFFMLRYVFKHQKKNKILNNDDEKGFNNSSLL